MLADIYINCDEILFPHNIRNRGDGIFDQLTRLVNNKMRIVQIYPLKNVYSNATADYTILKTS